MQADRHGSGDREGAKRPSVPGNQKSGEDEHERRGGKYEIVEIAGLYWHFVDLVWVFIFAFFYLW